MKQSNRVRQSWWCAKTFHRVVWAALVLIATACNQQARPNTDDQTSPTVTLENPVGGAAVSLSLTVQGTATDDQAVTRV
ncbi:MAG: hypothetical protein HZB27_14255, partial [Meiothermus silvanus]|nr:hypothetical protein [Allomeiothermus silvanus]